VGRPEGRAPLERPRRRWENNIKMDGGLGLDRSGSGQRERALVNAVMNLRIPKK
jgi:hypothetical protein